MGAQSLEGMLLELRRELGIQKYRLVGYKSMDNSDTENPLNADEIFREQWYWASKIKEAVWEWRYFIEQVNETTRSYDPNPFGGISSRVELRGKKDSRLFFIDFSCDVSAENEVLVGELVHKARVNPGYLFNSDNSYHFYSHGLYTPEDWRRTMTAIQGNSLVDGLWVERQLERDFSVLRITAKPSSAKPTLPQFVRFVGEKVRFLEEDNGQLYFEFGKV